jgi:hypothetical protein
MEKYEQPGERLHSKVPSDEYKEAYDRIFGKKQYWYEKKLEKEKDDNQRTEDIFTGVGEQLDKAG